MDTTYEQFVIGLAAPAARMLGADERAFGMGLAPVRARDLLRAMCGLETVSQARMFLGTLASWGMRAEWAQYTHHATWTPDPHDPSVVRKAAVAKALRTAFDDRAMVALDACRAATIAGWVFAAGLVTRDDGLTLAGPALIAAAAKQHRSWADLAEMLILSAGFAMQAMDEEAIAEVRALARGEGGWEGLAWPAKMSVPADADADADAADADDDDDDAAEDGDEDDDAGPEFDPETDAANAAAAVAYALEFAAENADTASGAPTMILALELTVDCPGCARPVHVDRIADAATCAHCATVIALAADDWDYFFADDARKRRKEPHPDDDLTNDFGERFFSRRRTRVVAAPTCPCGATLPVPDAPGPLACACGRVATVRAADVAARAITRAARLVIDAPTAPIPGAPLDAPCAACGAAIPLARTTPRIAACPACAARSYIDDARWFAWHGSPRRATSFVIA
ncbi:MAG: DUF1266 domain-containing protein [Deltaproteobacteria bacterium]|nr:DUF1266 domain-containing protein [Deltaproteobacteria bacterium]